MDSVCIEMPKDPREFFLAMPAVQDYIYAYVHEVKSGQRDPVNQFTFRMDEAPLKVAKNITPQYDYTGWSVKNRSEFTCFIDFNFDYAREMALCNKKHTTEVLRLTRGSRPRKWPILPPPRNTQGKGILILNWDRDLACDWSGINFLKSISRDSNAIDLQDEIITMDRVQSLEVDTVEAVIGPASAITLLASAHNRKVIEIFPDIESYILYNNEGITNYRAIIGKPTVEMVIQAWHSFFVQQDTLEVLDESILGAS